MLLITAATSQGYPAGTPASHSAYHIFLGTQEPPEPRRREVDDERQGSAVHHGTHLAPAAPDELDEAVGDEARADPVGDGVRDTKMMYAITMKVVSPPRASLPRVAPRWASSK